MSAWFERLVGPEYATPAMWIVSGLVLVALLLALVRLMRGFASGTFVAGGRNRRTRLAVMDAAPVDSRRRLVLVRRDDVEHLILIGGPTDVVIEQDIRMVTPGRRHTDVQTETAAEREPAAPPARPPEVAKPRLVPPPAAQRPATQPQSPASAPVLANLNRNGGYPPRPAAPAPTPPAPSVRPVVAVAAPHVRDALNGAGASVTPAAAVPTPHPVAPPTPVAERRMGPPREIPAPVPIPAPAPAHEIVFPEPEISTSESELAAPERGFFAPEPETAASEPEFAAPDRGFFASEAEIDVPKPGRESAPVVQLRETAFPPPPVAVEPEPPASFVDEDEELLRELEFTLDEAGSAPPASPDRNRNPDQARDETSLEDEMSKLLGELSGERR